MKEVMMIKNGELALKGLNRHAFEEALMKNIRWRLKDLGKFTITRAQSTMYVQTDDPYVDYDEVADRLSKIFGIAALYPRRLCGKGYGRHQAHGGGIYGKYSARCAYL